MSDLTTLIEHLEAALAEARAFQAERDAPAPEEQFPDDLVDLAVVAQEFDMQKDTLRKLCREKRIGIKIEDARWMVSVSKLRSIRPSLRGR